ncbi:hypothetical protein AGMMS49592_5330 [Endomicrobiia bacterium]|nr:hypothetical protein AGMMS49592_5330 [Endomicrobiia bacterium]
MQEAQKDLEKLLEKQGKELEERSMEVQEALNRALEVRLTAQEGLRMLLGEQEQNKTKQTHYKTSQQFFYISFFYPPGFYFYLRSFLNSIIMLLRHFFGSISLFIVKRP